MRPEIRRTTYHVLFADGHQQTLDGDELESAIRSGQVTNSELVALADGVQRRYWEYPRFASLVPTPAAVPQRPRVATATTGYATAASIAAPPEPVASARPVPFAAATPSAPPAASVAVMDAMPLSPEERKVDEVMARLGDVRQRLMSRPSDDHTAVRRPSGAVAPVSSTAPVARGTPAAVDAVRPPAMGGAPLRQPVPTPLAPSPAAPPAPRRSGAVPPVAGGRNRAPSASELDLAAQALAAVESHAPLLERKYGGGSKLEAVDADLDGPSTLDEALAEINNAASGRRGLVDIPRKSERGKAVLAVILLAIAAFMIARLVNQ